jgi:hypothetical protein
VGDFLVYVFLGIAVLYVYWAVVAAIEGKYFQFSTMVVWTAYLLILIFKRLMEI